MKNGIHIVNLKICNRTLFYSIFNMSSCRKREIHNDLPNITNILTTIHLIFKNKENPTIPGF